MPRRPAVIEHDIPLYLIPYLVRRGVYTHGEELERIDVKKLRRHFYTISIRTKHAKRELKGRHPPCGVKKADKPGKGGELE